MAVIRNYNQTCIATGLAIQKSAKCG